MTYNGYNVGKGGGYNWGATADMKAQGYYDTPSYLSETVSDAFEIWDNRIDFNFYGTSTFDHSFVYVGMKIVGSSSETTARTVFNDPDGDGRLGAQGSKSYGDGTAQIYLDLSYSDRTDLDKIYEVLVHEVGHIVGLSDSTDPNSIMYPGLDGDPTITATDRSNLLSLYANLPPDIVTTTTTTPAPTSGITRGTSSRDSLVGVETNDSIYGYGGNDILWGHGGTDKLFGGSGNDLIYGNTEIDLIYGGSGNDTIFGGQNSGTARADAYGNIRQQDGTETIYGDSGNDLIYGNFGNEIISGGTGDDTIYGGQNEDTLYGGDGNDHIFGNRDNDTLYGGAGADSFYTSATSGHDRIEDYELGVDSLWLMDGSATTITESGGNAVFNIGSDGAKVELVGISKASLGSLGYLV